MKSIAVGLLLFSMQTAPTVISAGSLVGKWTTTVTPPPGNAPVVSPSFVLALQDGKLMGHSKGKPRQTKPRYSEAVGVALRRTLPFSLLDTHQLRRLVPSCSGPSPPTKSDVKRISNIPETAAAAISITPKCSRNPSEPRVH